MLVSPDRLGWTYGGSLATDSQSWCQLLWNIHRHTLSHTYTHISALFRICCSELWAVPYFLLSDYLRTCSTRASWEFWKPPQFPVIPRAAVQSEGWTALLIFANALPWRGRMRQQIKVQAASAHTASAKLCSKNSPAWIAFPPSHHCLCVFCLAWVYVCQLSLCASVLSGACADSWPRNPFQESQVEFCVKQRSIIGKPDWQWDFLLSLFLLYKRVNAEPVAFSHIGMLPTGLLFVVLYSGCDIIESRSCY